MSSLCGPRGSWPSRRWTTACSTSAHSCWGSRPYSPTCNSRSLQLKIKAQRQGPAAVCNVCSICATAAGAGAPLSIKNALIVVVRAELVQSERVAPDLSEGKGAKTCEVGRLEAWRRARWWRLQLCRLCAAARAGGLAAPSSSFWGRGYVTRAPRRLAKRESEPPHRAVLRRDFDALLGGRAAEARDCEGCDERLGHCWCLGRRAAAG